MVANGEFLESCDVHGNMYGTSKAALKAVRDSGRFPIIEIDVQGALQLMGLGVEGVYVFVAPPDFEELRRRLVERGSESPESLVRRLNKAEDEYRERNKYDHVVVNDDLDRAVTELSALIDARAEPT